LFDLFLLPDLGLQSMMCLTRQKIETRPAADRVVSRKGRFRPLQLAKSSYNGVWNDVTLETAQVPDGARKNIED
jgi:hypothetical protein